MLDYKLANYAFLPAEDWERSQGLWAKPPKTVAKSRKKHKKCSLEGKIVVLWVVEVENNY
ncbi:MAG: hypothetical protein ACI308_07620 [Muribaculaceae bacterium]